MFASDKRKYFFDNFPDASYRLRNEEVVGTDGDIENETHDSLVVDKHEEFMNEMFTRSSDRNRGANQRPAGRMSLEVSDSNYSTGEEEKDGGISAPIASTSNMFNKLREDMRRPSLLKGKRGNARAVTLKDF